MKLLLLDDHQMFGKSFAAFLEEYPEVELCDYVDSSDSFFQSLDQMDYDILIVDIDLDSEMTGFDIIKKLLKEKPEAKTVILSSYNNLIYQKKALELGAKDYIEKSLSPDTLVSKLLKVYDGENNLKKSSFQVVLTKREIEILQNLKSGMKNKEIAEILFISKNTLRNHLSTIYEKLEVDNKMEAVLKGIKLGYIDPIL